MERPIQEVMNGVPDYRKGNAIKHKLSDILMIGLLTFVCNGNDYAAMYVFAQTHFELLKTFLALPNGIPSQDTFERVFQNVSPKYLTVNFKRWVDEVKEEAKKSETARILVGIDGKTIRGSKRSGKKAVHVVSAFASELRMVLGEVAVDKKSNEITAIPELLEMFCQKGMVITIDAMGTQKEIAATIVEKGADYVLSLKGNHKSLFERASKYLEYGVMSMNKELLRENGQYAQTLEKGHGRIEKRECYISFETDWLWSASEWKGIAGFGVIVTTREEMGKEPTISYNYFIFSLENTDASEILRIKRSHWAIENNLHWSLDMLFREDDSRATSGNSAENLNILRKEALKLMKDDSSMKASLRSKRLRCGWDIAYAFSVIGVK